MLPIHYEPVPDYILPHIRVQHLQEARHEIAAGNLIQLIGQSLRKNWKPTFNFLQTMNRNYTLGNWHSKDGQIYPQETGKTLAIIPYYDHSKEEDKANARLIAAAPDLLEGLKEMVRMYESVQPAGGWQGVYEGAKAAINKATQP